MDVNAVLAAMLSAAEGAAGGVWNQIKDSLAISAKDAANNCVEIAADLAAGTIDEAEAQTLFQAQKDLMAVVADEVEGAAKLAAEAAINAAGNALWAGITAGLHI